MGNLRLRAGEIGAELRFSDARPGTCVTLAFDLGGATARREGPA
jgi:hypothetical protein